MAFDPSMIAAMMNNGSMGPAPSVGTYPAVPGLMASFLNNIPGVGGLGKVPGMGQVPEANGPGMAAIPGNEAAAKVPGAEPAAIAGAYDAQAGGGAGNKMAQILGMEALRQLDQAQKRPMPTIAAGSPPRPQSTPLQLPGYTALGALPPGLAQLLVGR